MKLKIIAGIASSTFLLSMLGAGNATAASQSGGSSPSQPPALPSQGKTQLAAGSEFWQATWDSSTNALTKPTKLPTDAQSSQRIQAQNKISAIESSPRIIFTTNADGTITDRYFSSPKPTTVEAKTGRTTMQWFANSSDVELRWWSPSNNTKWTVYRDGKKLSETRSSSFTDSDPKQSANSQYSVVAERSYTDNNGEKQTQAFNYGVNIPPLPDYDVDGKDVLDASVRTVGANSDIAGGEVPAQAGFSETALAYNTFIPFKRIKRPKVCFPTVYDELGGDNRNFATKKDVEWKSLSNRIQNIAYITWEGKKAIKTGISNKVGTTRAYVKGKEVKSAKAGTQNLKTTMTPNTSNASAKVRFVQNASDPLCQIGVLGAPNINADVSATISQSNGSVRAVGSHDGAPNHEILMTHITPSGKFQRGCVYRYYLSDFMALIPPLDVALDVTINPTGNWTWDCPVYEKAGLGG